MVGLNLEKIQQWISSERLVPGTPEQPITMKDLLDSRCVHRIHPEGGVKSLCRGSQSLFTHKIYIVVSRASRNAIDLIEKRGGSIVTVYYNRLGLRVLLKPEKFKLLPQQASPIKPKDREYYKSAKNRGYLSPKVEISVPDNRWVKILPGHILPKQI